MIRGLEKIKSLEEYELAKKDLQYCIHEYKWISESKNPKQEIEDELKKCMKDLHENMDRDEELALLSKIHTLKTKYIAIVRDEYKNEVKTNILGLILITEQYEAANQDVSFTDLISGLLRGSPEIKNYLRRKYMFTLSNMYGIVPAPQSLNIEKMEDILDYVAKNYDLVDIDLSDRKEINEVSLTTVQEPVVGIKASAIKVINERFGAYAENVSSQDNKEKYPSHNDNMEVHKIKEEKNKKGKEEIEK